MSMKEHTPRVTVSNEEMARQFNSDHRRQMEAFSSALATEQKLSAVVEEPVRPDGIDEAPFIIGADGPRTVVHGRFSALRDKVDNILKSGTVTGRTSHAAPIHEHVLRSEARTETYRQVYVEGDVGPDGVPGIPGSSLPIDFNKLEAVAEKYMWGTALDHKTTKSGWLQTKRDRAATPAGKRKKLRDRTRAQKKARRKQR